jgi:hypothetical protein
MRRNTLFTVILSLAVAALIVAQNALPAPAAPAASFLEGMPRLDGVRIYFSESEGEPSRFDRSPAGLSRFAGLIELLGADLYTLEWRTGIPADADLVVLAGPTADLKGEQIAWLWAYLQEGGHLLLLADPGVGANVKGFPGKSGLFTLLWTDMGLRARDDLLVAPTGQTTSAVPPGVRPKPNEPTPTPLPPVEVPVLTWLLNTSDLNTLHPMAANARGEVALWGARSIEIDGSPRESQVTPLLYAASEFYGETEFVTYQQSGFVEYNIDKDTAPGHLALGAAVEHIVTGTRVVLIGDREVAVNGFGLESSPPYSASFLYPGNARFLMSAVAWLVGADMTILQGREFPTPGPTVTPTITPSPTPALTATPVETPTPVEGGAS